MDEQTTARFERIEATLEQLAATDRRLQERQEALAERQEALAQSMELLTSMHRDNETRVAQLMDMMTRLGNIVISHDQRLDDLEGR